MEDHAPRDPVVLLQDPISSFLSIEFSSSLAAGDFGYSSCSKLGGYVGLLNGIDALLVAFVEVLNATAGRIVISLGQPLVQD